MKYRQLSSEERQAIGLLLCFKFNGAQIGRILGRSRSTICRERKRNAYPTDGSYKAYHAISMANGRRRLSRDGSRICRKLWRRIVVLLGMKFSPEQISGILKRGKQPSVSHETIYRYLWLDKASGGTLYKDLRQAGKRRRKRYGAYDSRGRLAGKRPIQDRPAGAENRSRTGHWEIDTVLGSGKACILTLVERKTGFVEIGKLKGRTVSQTNARLHKLMARHDGRFKTITADNGCEFHGYKKVEAKHPVRFYFAAPHHSWERGSNENTNGLIRQYLPKGMSLEKLTQKQCDMIAQSLNTRPRKRYQYRTPSELFLGA